MFQNKSRLFLSLLLCAVLTFGVSLPTYADVRTDSPIAEVSSEVIEAIESSPIDTAEVLIELNDYSIDTLNNSTVRTELSNDVGNIIDERNLENDTQTYSRIPVIATTVTSDQLEDLKTDDRVKSITMQKRYSVDDVKVAQDAIPALDQATTLLNASGAWNNSTPYTGTGQKIVIADTGVDKNHPFLNGSVITEMCFAKGPDYTPAQPSVGECNNGAKTQAGSGSASPCTSDPACYHGTHVAGIAAGRRNVTTVSPYAIAPLGGVAPNASIIAMKIFGTYTGINPNTNDPYCGPNPADEFDTCVLAENSDMLLALQWVLANSTGVAAVNFSLGFGGYTSQCDGYDYLFANTVNTLRNTYKVATVVASGNAYYVNKISSPACFSNAIAVGSTNKSGTINVASYSNTSAQVALFAPGSSIRSSVPIFNNDSGSSLDSDGVVDGYQSLSGTSMATPAIAGAFALLKQARPTETITQLLTRMQSTGLSVTDAKNTSVTRKVPNILSAINYSSSVVPSTPDSLSATAQYGYAYLAWPAVSGATSYRVINANNGATLADLGPSATAYNAPTAAYQNNTFAVRANSSAGSSAYRNSNVVYGLPTTSEIGYTFFAPNGSTLGLGSASPSTSGAVGGGVVGGSSNRYSNGAWAVTSGGDVYAYGYAGNFGSMGGQKLNKPMISIASTASSNGYWMVASDGGIFSFGDAEFYGSTGSIKLNMPVVGMAPTPSGNGYWMVASDGGIFSFGDAEFYGSTGSIRLNMPIVGMTPTPSGQGYWLVASDGGIFAFGDAGFYGSLGSTPLGAPVIGMKRNDAGTGYWIFTADGGVYSFGSAPFLGHAQGRGTYYVQAG